ncbi:hypothetical protein ACRALDRAFT_2020266 [Sodiomyces alcalophilus JCM 7366]|uniref:uncharacterized protein n=1 Tax=Sodiomyces alcalophilus JCM 7366 TaxID=591952 RepID=UPI0039B6688D
MHLPIVSSVSTQGDTSNTPDVANAQGRRRLIVALTCASDEGSQVRQERTVANGRMANKFNQTARDVVIVR